VHLGLVASQPSSSLPRGRYASPASMDIPGHSVLLRPDGILRRPVHFWAGFSSILFRSCLVWRGRFVRIRASNSSPLLWHQAHGESAGRSDLQNMVMRARPPSLFRAAARRVLNP